MCVCENFGYVYTKIIYSFWLNCRWWGKYNRIYGKSKHVFLKHTSHRWSLCLWGSWASFSTELLSSAVESRSWLLSSSKNWHCSICKSFCWYLRITKIISYANFLIIFNGIIWFADDTQDDMCTIGYAFSTFWYLWWREVWVGICVSYAIELSYLLFTMCSIWFSLIKK